VADRIGIDIDAVNFSAEYRDRVFNNFLAEYRAGRTPNPDVLCNAGSVQGLPGPCTGAGCGLDCYRPLREGSRARQHVRAAQGGRHSKDQSYFLYRLTQSQLSKTLVLADGDEFHLGCDQPLARKLELPNHAKRDSTGICFIGERPFREFLMRYLPTSPGPTESLDGRVVGTHQGLTYYTIGQRHGLGIGGQGEPWYVVHKDLERNRSFAISLDEVREKRRAGTAIPVDGPGVAIGFTRQRRATRRGRCAVHLIRADAVYRLRVDFDEPQWAIHSGAVGSAL
jgi:tRNA-specific 2-thiouridylase